MENFEGDYWGASMRQGLEWIMENDNRDSLTIISPEGIIATKLALLNEKQKGFSYIMRRKMMIRLNMKISQIILEIII